MTTNEVATRSPAASITKFLISFEKFMELSFLSEYLPFALKSGWIGDSAKIGKYSLSGASTESKRLVEDEVYHDDTTIWWSRGKKLKQSLNLTSYNETISNALWTEFSSETPEGRSRRALCIFLQTVVIVVYENGGQDTIKLPFTIKKAWSTSRGILLERDALSDRLFFLGDPPGPVKLVELPASLGDLGNASIVYVDSAERSEPLVIFYNEVEHVYLFCKYVCEKRAPNSAFALEHALTWTSEILKS